MRCGVQIEQNRFPRNRGVTLIELLMVMAVISLLVGFGVWGLRSAQDAQSRALAKSQVTMIAAALEQFKSEVGSYPPTGGVDKSGLTMLFNGVTVNSSTGAITEVTDPTNAQYGPWLDPQGFSVEMNSSKTEVTKITDPWGNEFLYGRDDQPLSSLGIPAAMPVASSQTQQFMGYRLFSWGAMGKYANTAAFRNPKGVNNALEYVERFGIHPE